MILGLTLTGCSFNQTLSLGVDDLAARYNTAVSSTSRCLGTAWQSDESDRVRDDKLAECFTVIFGSGTPMANLQKKGCLRSTRNGDEK